MHAKPSAFSAQSSTLARLQHIAPPRVLGSLCLQHLCQAPWPEGPSMLAGAKAAKEAAKGLALESRSSSRSLSGGGSLKAAGTWEKSRAGKP